MASWNDKDHYDRLSPCPVCLTKVANRNLQKHLYECYDRNKEAATAIGMIQCPFVPGHILPVMFLNNHLDGNCQGVFNNLRAFYQKDGEFKEYGEAPADFDPGIPKEHLSDHNRNLLYMLRARMHNGTYREQEKIVGGEAGPALEEASTSKQPENID